MFEDSPYKSFDEAMTSAGFMPPPNLKESTAHFGQKRQSRKKESIQLSPATKFKPVTRSSSPGPPTKIMQRHLQSASYDASVKSKKSFGNRHSLVDECNPDNKQQQPLSAIEFMRLFNRGEEEMTRISLVTESELVND